MIFQTISKFVTAFVRLISGKMRVDGFNQGRYIRRTTIFFFSFCTGLVNRLNGSALGVLKHHYITKKVCEHLIGNSRFLIYNSLNQLLYYTVQEKVALS